jgi:hypothetical protein
MTPDWAAGPITVPYASYGDPQSLNLYAYVGNNPNTGIDLDGHDNNDTMQLEEAEEQAGATAEAAAAAQAEQGVGQPSIEQMADAYDTGVTNQIITSGENQVDAESNKSAYVDSYNGKGVFAAFADSVDKLADKGAGSGYKESDYDVLNAGGAVIGEIQGPSDSVLASILDPKSYVSLSPFKNPFDYSAAYTLAPALLDPHAPLPKGNLPAPPHYTKPPVLPCAGNPTFKCMYP